LEEGNAKQKTHESGWIEDKKFFIAKFFQGSLG